MARRNAARHRVADRVTWYELIPSHEDKAGNPIKPTTGLIFLPGARIDPRAYRHGAARRGVLRDVTLREGRVGAAGHVPVAGGVERDVVGRVQSVARRGGRPCPHARAHRRRP